MTSWRSSVTSKRVLSLSNEKFLQLLVEMFAYLWQTAQVGYYKSACNLQDFTK